MTVKKISEFVWTNRSKAERCLVFIISVYVLIGFGLGKRCFDVFGHDSGDMAAFEQMMWHSSHGRLFHVTGMLVMGQHKPMNMLAIHSSFFWIFLMPFYVVVPGMGTLIFLQSAALGLAAVPMYLIARWVVRDEWAAVLLATAFILMPPIVSQHVNQVEEPSFLPVLLLFVVYFFLQHKFRPFLVMALVSCLNRENVPLAIAMFGLWALIERRHWKWVIAPMALGAAYFTLVIYVIMPYFRQDQPWHVTRQYAHLGDGALGIVTNLFAQPQLLVAQLFNFENLHYLIFLVQPMGWILPLVNPAAVIALPDLAANMLSSNSALRVIPWHYNLITGAALFVSLILTLRKVSDWLQQRGAGQRCAQVIGAVFVVLSLAHWFLWLQPQVYHRLPRHDALERAITVVPPEKSVVVPIRLIGHVAARESVSELMAFQNRPRYAAMFEYIIVDANERQYGPPITQDFFDKFYRNPTYQMVFAEENVFVFHRLGPPPDWSSFPIE